MRPLAKLVASLIVSAIALTVLAPAAMADGAGPTDYRTEIVAVEPATQAFELEMIGGDAFLSLELVEPVEVIVIGYRGEDYLRFDPDGTVWENRRSPSTWLNQERYGTEELPAFADHEAAPQWVQVADNGRYSWHDHRTHWMNDFAPLGAEPGDKVLEAPVPILVDGRAASIEVASWLLQPPARWPAWIGGAIATAAALLAVRSGRPAIAAVTLLGSLAAVALGVIAYRSVPSETEPERLLWLLPLVAVVAIVAVAAVRNRLSTTVYLDGLTVVAGVALAAWGLTRFDAIVRALIPSDAPAGLDRFVIGLAITMGAVVATRGLFGLARPQRLTPTPADT